MTLFLTSWKTVNPLRIALMVIVSLLWLLCFSSLFSKDRRKTRLKYRNFFKSKLGKFTAPEKRRTPRIHFPMAIKYRIINSSEKDTRTYFTGNAKDLSERGIFISTDRNITIGESLELKIPADKAARPLIIIGTVVRTEEDTIEKLHSLGIVFNQIDEEAKKILANYVEECLTEQKS